METLSLDEIDFSRQLESYLYRSEGDQLEAATDGILIRVNDLEKEGVAEIEMVANKRFPVDDPPDRLRPVADALEEFGEKFESFTRQRAIYELTVNAN